MCLVFTKKNGRKSLLLPICNWKHRTIWDTMKKVNSIPDRSSKAINMLVCFMVLVYWIDSVHSQIAVVDKVRFKFASCAVRQNRAPCALKERTTLWNWSSLLLLSETFMRTDKFSSWKRIMLYHSHFQKIRAIIKLDLMRTITYTALLKSHRIEENYLFKWCLTFVCNPFIFINTTKAFTSAFRHENYSTKVSIFIWVAVYFTVIATWLIIHDSEL